MKKIVLPGLAAGFAMLVVTIVVGFLTTAFLPSVAAAYMNPLVFRPWSDPLMYYMYLHPFVMGLVLAFVWHRFGPFCVCEISKGKGKKNPKRNPACCGALFGAGVWLLFVVPGMLMTIGTFSIPISMVCIWTFSALIQYKVGGMVIAKMSEAD